MELPNHLASRLESEVGIEPTFAVLQTDAYSSIDNSPIKRCGSQVWLPGTYNWTVLFLLYLRLLPQNGRRLANRTPVIGFGDQGNATIRISYEMAGVEGIEPPSCVP